MTAPVSGDPTRPSFVFTVDTHLFRELGQYLVGRNSTALIELVKNSYDADATEVVVHGEDLEDPERGVIVLTDNGTGMTPDEFSEGFLRIAARTKAEGRRLSRRYRRRYTGAKGVGRLAAHKLAREVHILSVPDRRGEGVRAVVDWDEIERYRTLDDLVGIPEVEAMPPDGTKPGTRIELRRLRSNWTDAERRRFLREVTSFQPPPALTEALPRKVVNRPIVFRNPKVNDSGSDDPGFTVAMSGVFEQGDEFWPKLYDIASWVIEIDAATNRVTYGIAPTPKTRAESPDAGVRKFERSFDADRKVPTFQARIIVREGRVNLPRATIEAHAGVRVYLEGFRVLPYGERGDDWLSLNSDATSRAPVGLTTLTESGLATGEGSEREELLILPNLNYHGAVFLTERGADTLQLLVNREGFIPDQAFESLRELVRLGIDLSTRVRARFKEASRRGRSQVRSGARSAPGQGPTPSDGSPDPRGEALANALTAVGSHLSSVRDQLEKGDVAGARSTLDEVLPIVREAADLHRDAMSEEAMLRVLGSVGLQTSSVVHELGGLATTSSDLAELVATIRNDRTVDAHARRRLAPLEKSLRDLQHAVERQAAYLIDVVSAEARRRRSRQPLAERFDAAVRLIAHLADQRRITIVNDLPATLRTPPMFPAEVTSVFANLLTNAVKAAGDGGSIRVHGGVREGVLAVRLENTGAVVDLADAERWFDPFESTTVEVHPVLGQGMGLGLTITRRILEEYRASIAFAEPSPGFTTAVEIRFPT